MPFAKSFVVPCSNW